MVEEVIVPIQEASDRRSTPLQAVQRRSGLGTIIVDHPYIRSTYESHSVPTAALRDGVDGSCQFDLRLGNLTSVRTCQALQKYNRHYNDGHNLRVTL
jgi:hypothetical protein